jgi:hypothetical protein
MAEHCVGLILSIFFLQISFCFSTTKVITISRHNNIFCSHDDEITETEYTKDVGETTGDIVDDPADLNSKEKNVEPVVEELSVDVWSDHHQRYLFLICLSLIHLDHQQT